MGTAFEPDEKLFARIGKRHGAGGEEERGVRIDQRCGILLPGKGWPGVRPDGGILRVLVGSLVLGTVMGVLSALKSPLRCDWGTAVSGDLAWPITNLRHSWFQKKKVFLRAVLYSFGMNSGPADVPAVDVIAQLGDRRAGHIGEEVIGVQRIVAEEFVDRAVEIVRAGLDGHVDGAGGADAEIARRVAGQGLEFVDGVDRGHHGDAAAAAAIVVLAAVDHPDVVFRALAVEADVGAGADGYGQVEIGQIGGGARDVRIASAAICRPLIARS